MVGPIVSTPFYRALDGEVRITNPTYYSSALHQSFRGPFKNVTQYMSSPLRAELYYLAGYGTSAAEEAEGEQVIKMALELCARYPGEHPVVAGHRPYDSGTLTKRFSIELDDFRLSNIMVSFTYLCGHVPTLDMLTPRF